MPEHAPRSAVECIEASAGCNPERALPVFEHESNVIAGQTVGIVRIVAIVGEVTGGRIQSIQAIAGRQPQYPVPILGHMFQVPGGTGGIVRIGAKAGERLGHGIESVKLLIDADPQDPGSVLQYRKDSQAAQAVRVVRNGLVGLEAIPVIAVQPV